jgi:hypothetical protein
VLSRPYAACLAEVGLARRTLWPCGPRPPLRLIAPSSIDLTSSVAEAAVAPWEVPSERERCACGVP